MPKSNRSKSALQDVASFPSWSSPILQEGSDERSVGNVHPQLWPPYGVYAINGYTIES